MPALCLLAVLQLSLEHSLQDFISGISEASAPKASAIAFISGIIFLVAAQVPLAVQPPPVTVVDPVEKHVVRT